jgi:hypothetical protein
MLRRLLLVAACVSAAALARAQAPASIADRDFAQLIASLSEPAGYFDTDNLISNEDSYLHAVGTLRRLGITGGAYLGVGPGQNFSYIAAIRPRVAFIIDIRRDNLLQHLMFKSMFSVARNRIEYLCLLFGKRTPADTTGWSARDIGSLLTYVDSARTDPKVPDLVLDRVKRSPVPLSPKDLSNIARFHRAFIEQGPSLRFNSFGRAPQPYYPDLRRLLTETDRTGRQSSYLAHEADFQYARSLQTRNLVVPLVGDFGGPKTIVGVAGWLRAHREPVSAFYTSNVEQYLFRSGAFARFARSVTELPHDTRSVMIRSFFQGAHPRRVDGYHATQLMQRMSSFSAVVASGGFGSYYDLVTRDLIDY